MTQHILVLNSGSSSIKFQVLDLQAENPDVPFLSGLVEQIGESRGHIRIVTENNTIEDRRPILSHSVGLERAFGMMSMLGVGPQDLDVHAVGHRVVQGGSIFNEPVIIDESVKNEIRGMIPLAPLHNPANLDGIENAQSLLPDVPHVAVFDTAFFHSLPESAARYAINRDIADQYHIRRYGAHGTSHQYVSGLVPDIIGKDPADVNQITLHLGNGASATAIRGGEAIDTSMGLTPLAGLVMGTRTGDIDPSVIFHLAREAKMSIDEIDTLFNRRSGLKGLCGVNDFRLLQELINEGEKDAQEAYDIYVHRVRQYVGSYMLELGRLDAITFTAGVGENHVGIRRDTMAGLENFGIRIDDALNNNEAGVKGARIISTEDSAVKVLVVPTNEELAIARAAAELADN
ncbi:acetate kinase [Corynebacterium variabile]|uniref:Acetate kinase n=2 Tax=Corynebacterium variabile TaxID=1727 RepID=A0A0X2NMT6_9CORY|nr:acetate kinase [Corynebacterium variabile]AEK35806.1 Acetate kinase [Corynebacterium variabile DSM 44702]MDN6660498.1 acetate kinase [Corynebacterium variabile]CUU66802.1 acetate kinase [Corynebacterium variabile]